jgi:hypothetical protein
MDIVKAELSSSSWTGGNEVIGVEAERVTDIKEEEDQEATTVPFIKTEPKVTAVL